MNQIVSVAARPSRSARAWSALGKGANDVVDGTAPVWGIGRRIFFFHDGRTQDLLPAVKAHASSGSEANTVIANFNALNAEQQQDILNFLRSL
jgi:CxxC motif-containing protein (DUF1111 family)